MDSTYNETSLDSLCAALAAAMGIDPPEHAAPANETLLAYLDGRKADRLFLFNPDAIAQWIYRKYPQLFTEVRNIGELELPFRTVMPSVTPVCFGTFYTGAQPEVHGIRKYEKPVIRIDTLFDAMLRAGKKCVIVALKRCSMGNIFLERDMDYFIYDTPEDCNRKAMELIEADEYDLITLYNGNYDATMHRNAPEGEASLQVLAENARVYAELRAKIEACWTGHRTLLGFCPDHGCHEIDGGLGSHGLEMIEDMNVVHMYALLDRK